MPVTPNSIITPQVPRSASGVASLANTTYGDAPAGAVLIFAAGPNGARVSRVSAVTRASLTATECQLFRDHDGTGTVKRFFASRLMPAVTVSPSTAQAAVDFGYSDSAPLLLGAGEKLYGAIGQAQTGVVFCVEGADY
ncbi:MAG: hypothetical protein INE97_12180 [Phenylobacterium sp.]|jgi:hypothetical protein|nr:hypothetical protein [Phenylobacterium sp.]